MSAPVGLPTPATREEAMQESSYGLWIGDQVLTINLQGTERDFPPSIGQIEALNKAIQDLARAAKSVVFHAENDKAPEFIAQSIEGIADAIMMMSQLSMAVHKELGR